MAAAPPPLREGGFMMRISGSIASPHATEESAKPKIKDRRHQHALSLNEVGEFRADVKGTAIRSRDKQKTG